MILKIKEKVYREFNADPGECFMKITSIEHCYYRITEEGIIKLVYYNSSGNWHISITSDDDATNWLHISPEIFEKQLKSAKKWINNL